MSSDLVTCLHLDKKYDEGRIIVVKELNGCDSSFILSCLIGHSIKTKTPTILILSHNLLSHYHNVGLRMFYNLNKSIDERLITVCDISNDNELDNFVYETYINNICSKINDLQRSNEEVNVFVEGVSHMLDLGCNIQIVNKFCRTITKLVRSHRGIGLLQFNVAIEDDVTSMIANLMSHMAETVVHVESLSSGWSNDVGGHLKVIHSGDKFNDVFTFKLASNAYLFKLFDKGVKLFAPGAV